MVLVLVLLIAAMQPPAGAQVLLYPHAPGATDPNGYIPIITGFIAAELLAERIPTQVAESTFDLQVEEVMTGIDTLNPLMRYGEDGGYEFVILCVLNENGADMELYFHVIDVVAGEIAFSIEKQTQPTLMIDVAVSRSVGMIVEKIDDSVFVADAVADEPEKITPEKEPDTVKETIIPVAPPEVRRVSNVPLKGFAASAGIGSIVFLGSAADFLRAGVTATVTGTYGLPLLSGRFDFGVHLGGFFIEPQKATAESNVIISPVGVFLGYTSATGSFLDIAFSLNGGMSIFAARIEQQPYLVKAAPYLAGGPGFIIVAGGRMSVQLEVLVNVFFEGQEMIFGYAPHLNILLR